MSGAIRSLLMLVLVVGALGALGLTFVFKNLDGEIRARVEAKFADHYTHLEVSVREARRLPGEGIEVRGLSLSEPGGRLLAFVDEAFFGCSTDLTEWATGEPAIEQIVLRRLKVHAASRRDGSWNIEQLYPFPSSGGHPTLSLEDAQIEISAGESGRALVLNDVDLQVVPYLERRPATLGRVGEAARTKPRQRIRGSLSGADIGRIDVQAIVD